MRSLSPPPLRADTSRRALPRPVPRLARLRNLLRRSDDPRVPGEGRLAETFAAFVTSVVSVAVMGSAALVLSRPFLFPSLGATVFLLFHRSTAGAASPRNTIYGHGIGVLCGLVSLALTGQLDAPSAFVQGMDGARVAATSLSLGLTSAAMTGLRVPHPPAGATTLIVSLGLITSWVDVGVLMAAIVSVVGIASIVHGLAGTPYPRWAPFPSPPGP